MGGIRVRLRSLCLLFLHPRAPNLIGLRSDVNSPRVAYIHRLLHRFQPKPWRKKRQDFSAFALTYILRLNGTMPT